MDTVFQIHSDLRWLVVAVAVITAIRLAVGFFGQQAYDRLARNLMLVFGILIDVQMLVGIIYFVWLGIEYGTDFWQRYHFEHLAAMLVAVALAHLPRRWRTAPDVQRYRNDLVIVICVLAVIFVGVVALAGGMDRWEPNF
jgi:hypothetical protein